MDDERIRTLGDAWQHAIGNVIGVLLPQWFGGVKPTL